VLERAMVLTTGRVIEAVDLPGGAEGYQREPRSAGAEASLGDWLKEQEKHYLAQKLAVFQGNIAVTARSCGIGVRTLSRKMRQYELDKSSFKQKGAAESAADSENPAFTAPDGGVLTSTQVVPAPKIH
jgi:two-component system, NtrC family, response regulator AtoC